MADVPIDPSALWETAFICCHWIRFPQIYQGCPTDPRELERVVIMGEEEYERIICLVLNAAGGRQYTQRATSWKHALQSHLKRLFREGWTDHNPLDGWVIGDAASAPPLPPLSSIDRVLILYDLIADQLARAIPIRELLDKVSQGKIPIPEGISPPRSIPSNQNALQGRNGTPAIPSPKITAPSPPASHPARSRPESARQMSRRAASIKPPPPPPPPPVKTKPNAFDVMRQGKAKSRTTLLDAFLRWSPLGVDGRGRDYYYFGDTPRLYRSYMTGKGRAKTNVWEVASSTLEELRDVIEGLSTARKVEEKRLLKKLTTEVLPLAELSEKRRESKEKAKERAVMVHQDVEILDSRTRKRPRINYSFDLDLEDEDEDEGEGGDDEDDDFDPDEGAQAENIREGDEEDEEGLAQPVHIHGKRTRAMQRYLEQVEPEDTGLSSSSSRTDDNEKDDYLPPQHDLYHEDGSIEPTEEHVYDLSEEDSLLTDDGEHQSLPTDQGISPLIQEGEKTRKAEEDGSFELDNPPSPSPPSGTGQEGMPNRMNDDHHTAMANREKVSKGDHHLSSFDNQEDLSSLDQPM